MESTTWFPQELVTTYALNAAEAAVILIAGWVVARVIRAAIEKVLRRRGLDNILVSFVSNLTYVGLIAFVVIAALARVGIQTTSLIPVVGAAGLAVGLALQGSLANFAAGLLMIVFRPFK